MASKGIRLCLLILCRYCVFVLISLGLPSADFSALVGMLSLGTFPTRESHLELFVLVRLCDLALDWADRIGRMLGPNDAQIINTLAAQEMIDRID